ncbi:class I SAM-dependent methyltransferase [Algoriphagus sediminis]|uniref:Methyltransferase domain-containing protein n=1 Tax=Algoriphagus sediminis TaxID=3057113 RepID=A0ABT7YDV5_9BACT|nr:methyltransferase domain-containing protein [Algoriphagus sediminis]MDN3204699.1 methyltransferase domain-containing protein [Algoriphagus sediminis]
MNYVHVESTHNTKSAEQILPFLIELLNPKSIIDIGCGIGTWLSIAKELGVKDIKGVDGDYVDLKLLGKYLSQDEFHSHDLNQPLNLERKFDLCLCLEVAEHLKDSSADILIESLSHHSDTILFSAAIPGQGGQNHLNEQRPEYWIDKFRNQGYEVYDPIRPEFWDHPEVDVWYKQNIFLFSKDGLDQPKPLLSYVVHPDLYQVQLAKKLQFEDELNRIKTGKANAEFYLKRFFKALLN